tara:strand:- start:371 stop:625 length:255 start_codon:yes stop_codon:yes gene_type:complete
MKVNDVVCFVYGNALRFGRVKRFVKENGWLFAEVNWIKDEAYREAVKWEKKLGRDSEFRKLYRIDYLMKIDVDHLQRVVEALSV